MECNDESVHMCSCTRIVRALLAKIACLRAQVHNSVKWITDDLFLKHCTTSVSGEESLVVILRTSSSNHLMIYFILVTNLYGQNYLVINKRHLNLILMACFLWGLVQDLFYISMLYFSIMSHKSYTKNPLLQSH